jgi:hypothetical protein
MAIDLKKLREFLTGPLCPPTIVQLSSSYVSGIHVDLKDGRAKRHSVLELPSGTLDPHFDRKNIADPAGLAAVLKEALHELQVSGKKIACLVPEACLRILVLSFESLPGSDKEREKVIRWRAKKQMAVLPEDARLSYEIVGRSSSTKILAALARIPVIREYESVFAGLGFEVGIAASPTVSLLNLVDWEHGKDLMVVNVEEDSLGLLAVTQSEPSLYRLKTFAVGEERETSFSQKVEAVIKEIENTVHFIEDREKRAIESLWFRSGLKPGRDDVLAELRASLGIEVHPLLAPAASGLSAGPSAFLAPLAGLLPGRGPLAGRA